MSEVVAREVVVQGRVQGVFFRDSCRGEAEAAGVAGWVSNEPDGTVHAHFEGDRGSVERLVDWTRQGPAHAHVRGVDVIDVRPQGLTRFEVR